MRTGLRCAAIALLALAPIGGAATFETTGPVTVPAVAVAQLANGTLIGTSSTVSVSVATGGSGLVFIDTRPLAEVDMQGSARLAARMAAAITGFAENEHDFFFVVRSSSSIIGGPSAGAVLTLAAIVALENAHLPPGAPAWTIDPAVAATGTVNPDGTVGPVGGIPQKADAARSIGARLFLVPAGQGNYTPLEHGGGGQPGTPVNMSSFCRDRLGIVCREAGRITDLVRLATGHDLRPPGVGTPTTADYRELLGPGAGDMVEAASARVALLSDQANASAIDEAQRGFVLDALANARPPLALAREAVAAERYYSATSFAFQAGRQAALAEGLLQYFSRGRDLAAVADRIDEARQWIRDATDVAATTPVRGINDLLAVGASQERVTQAEGLLAASLIARNASRDMQDVTQALDSAGFAIERAKTVIWWAGLTEHFGPGPPLGAPAGELAHDYLDATRETVEYAQAVGAPASDFLQEAVRYVRLAERDLARGFAPGALVEAAQAQVFATMALGTGTTGPERVAAARDEAADAIAAARERGVEAVLAVSLFEFGGDNEATSLGIQFYREARVIAGMTAFLGGDGEPAPSVFIGKIDHLEAVGRTPSQALRAVGAGYFVLGMFVTTLVALFLATALRHD